MELWYVADQKRKAEQQVMCLWILINNDNTLSVFADKL